MNAGRRKIKIIEMEICAANVVRERTEERLVSAWRKGRKGYGTVGVRKERN